MAGAIEPKEPEPGWETRWILQAIGMIARAPLAAAIVLAAAIAIGLADRVLGQVLPGFTGIVVTASLLAGFGGAVLVAVMWAFMRAENYPAREAGEMSGPVAQLCLAVFLVISAMVTVAVMITVWQIATGSIPDTSYMPDRSPEGQLAWDGINPILGAMMGSLIVNPLWPALIPSMGFDFRGARQAQMQMLTRLRQVWFAMALIVLVVANFAMLLPVLVSGVICLGLMAWLYVAAREIFGGISENTTTEAGKGLTEA